MALWRGPGARSPSRRRPGRGDGQGGSHPLASWNAAQRTGVRVAAPKGLVVESSEEGRLGLGAADHTLKAVPPRPWLRRWPCLCRRCEGHDERHDLATNRKVLTLRQTYFMEAVSGQAPACGGRTGTARAACGRWLAYDDKRYGYFFDGPLPSVTSHDQPHHQTDTRAHQRPTATAQGTPASSEQQNRFCFTHRHQIAENQRPFVLTCLGPWYLDGD